MFIYTKYAEHPPCPLKRSLLSILRSRLHKHHLTFSHAISVNLIKFITLIRPKLKLIYASIPHLWSPNDILEPPPRPPHKQTLSSGYFLIMYMYYHCTYIIFVLLSIQEKDTSSLFIFILIIRCFFLLPLFWFFLTLLAC